MSQVGKLANFLDGIPVVASTAQRAVLFPSPDTDQRVFNKETGFIERFDGANWQQDIGTGKSGSFINIQALGAVGDGVADDTAALQAAYTAQLNYRCGIYAPATATGYKITGLNITRRGLRLVGDRDGRPTQGGGTRFLFTPASQANPTSCIQLGTSGIANDPFFDASYDANDYSGPQELYIENVSFAYAGSTSIALNNGAGTYGTNTVGLRDFKAGSVHLSNVWFENFQYGFWGVQSDFDNFTNAYAIACKTGFYFGPRSDQLSGTNCQALNCDTGVWLDRCAGHVWTRLNLIGCGKDTSDTPLRIESQYAADGSHDHLFLNPWYEQRQNANNVEAIVQIGGLTDVATSQDITIIRPVILTFGQGTTPHAVYFARFGNGSRLSVLGWGDGTINLLKHFKFTHGTTAANVYVQAHDSLIPTYDNTGAATPVIAFQTFGPSQSFGSSNGRVFVKYSSQATNYANNWQIGSESQRAIFIQHTNIDNTGGAANILGLLRSVQHGNTAPTTGTWRQGDRVINQAPTVGSVVEWECTSNGTPGTWVPMAVVPGTSADRGDTSVTIVAGTDAPTQKFNTPLTAGRTVTLSTTGVWNGAKFRIVRTAAATGASTLTVGAKTLALGQFIDVEYDGSAWNEVSFGSL